MNFEEILKFSFLEWFKRSESWKYALLTWLINIVSLIGLVLLGFLFFSDIISAVLFNNASNAEIIKTFLTPTAIASIIGRFFLFIPVLVIFFVITVLISQYISVLVQLFAFRCKEVSFPNFSFSKFIKFILLSIAQIFVTLFFPFNSLLLIIQWLCLLALIAAIPLFFISPLISLFLFLAILPYAFIVIYNGFRFFVAQKAFLHKDIGIMDSLKLSWNLTRGKVLDIFIACFAVLLVLAIITFILSVIISLLFNLIFSLIVAKPVLANFTQGISNIIASLIIAPLPLLVHAFLGIAIYISLIEEKMPSQIKLGTENLPMETKTLPAIVPLKETIQKTKEISDVKKPQKTRTVKKIKKTVKKANNTARKK